MVTILLIAKSEAIGSLDFKESAFACYELQLPAIAVLPEVGNDAVRLLWAVDNVCKRWVFPPLNDGWTWRSIRRCCAAISTSLRVQPQLWRRRRISANDPRAARRTRRTHSAASP